MIKILSEENYRSKQDVSSREDMVRVTLTCDLSGYRMLKKLALGMGVVITPSYNVPEDLSGCEAALDRCVDKFNVLHEELAGLKTAFNMLSMSTANAGIAEVGK